jgi:hypothetical protein
VPRRRGRCANGSSHHLPGRKALFTPRSGHMATRLRAWPVEPTGSFPSVSRTTKSGAAGVTERFGSRASVVGSTSASSRFKKGGHCFRVTLSQALRNVTITLDEETARWARVEAAKRDTSASRLVGDMSRERMLEDGGYESAMKSYLSCAALPLGYAAQRPTRASLHDRARLR